MNKKEKEIYIYEQIRKNSINHNIIYDFVKQHDICYTENNNGIFCNISIISNDKLNELYTIIHNYLAINNTYNIELDNFEKIFSKLPNKNVNTKKVYKKLNVKFNDKEMFIINQSRLFKIK